MNDRMRTFGLASLLAGILAALAYLTYRLREQDAEIAHLRASAERPPRQPAASEARSLPVGSKTERTGIGAGNGASLGQAPSPASALDQPESAPLAPRPEAEPEPSEEERRARQAANVARMVADFHAQPLDRKAASTQNEFQLAVDAELEGELGQGFRRGAMECRAGWCSMPIEYEPDVDLGAVDRAMHVAAASLSSESTPVMSRLTKPSANGTSRDGRYFFRWKPGSW